MNAGRANERRRKQNEDVGGFRDSSPLAQALFDQRASSSLPQMLVLARLTHVRFTVHLEQPRIKGEGKTALPVGQSGSQGRGGGRWGGLDLLIEMIF